MSAVKPEKEKGFGHAIGVLCVGVIRGLRSQAQRQAISDFLDSLGPPTRADVFGVFELPDHHDAVAVGPSSATLGLGDKACGHEERTNLLADAFGRQGRIWKVRLETREEVAEARDKSHRAGFNSWALAQFHKVRLAFRDLAAHEIERGWRYAAVLRIRTDQTFPRLAPNWLNAATLDDDTVYLQKDFVYIGSRAAIGNFSRLWDAGMRAGGRIRRRRAGCGSRPFF